MRIWSNNETLMKNKKHKKPYRKYVKKDIPPQDTTLYHFEVTCSNCEMTTYIKASVHDMRRKGKKYTCDDCEINIKLDRLKSKYK